MTTIDDLVARLERLEKKLDSFCADLIEAIQAARGDIENACVFYDEYIDAEFSDIHETLGLKRDESHNLVRLETPRQSDNGAAPVRQTSGRQAPPSDAKLRAIDAMRHGATPQEAATQSGASLRSCQRWRKELAS